uniref:peptidylprolyl isomerase n=1 Tax=Salix viminalis TaxID=40686 RepID=A0A6N2NEN2_SALVM
MSDSIDLSGDGGVVKTILRKSKADALCPSEDLPLVDVHYEGTLAETGEVFDTTRLDNTVFSFELGKGSVIQAWEIAVKTMKVGEVAKITCKPEFAYGSAGSLPDIPPYATLIFEVELVACKPRKGSSVTSVSEERARLEELKKQREVVPQLKRKRRRGEKKLKLPLLPEYNPSWDRRKVRGRGRERGKQNRAMSLSTS